MWGERMVNGFRREAEHKIWVVFWQVVKILFLRDCFVSKSDFHFQKARGVKFLPLYFELPCHTITFFFKGVFCQNWNRPRNSVQKSCCLSCPQDKS